MWDESDLDECYLEGLEFRFFGPGSPSNPTEWLGVTVDWRELLVRYRFGRLQVFIDSEVVYAEKIGSDYDGHIELDEVIERTGIIPGLKCPHENEAGVFQFGAQCKDCMDTGVLDVPELPDSLKEMFVFEPEKFQQYLQERRAA